MASSPQEFELSDSQIYYIGSDRESNRTLRIILPNGDYVFINGNRDENTRISIQSSGGAGLRTQLYPSEI